MILHLGDLRGSQAFWLFQQGKNFCSGQYFIQQLKRPEKNSILQPDTRALFILL